jgi:hypothetical protein
VRNPFPIQGDRSALSPRSLESQKANSGQGQAPGHPRPRNSKSKFPFAAWMAAVQLS